MRQVRKSVRADKDRHTTTTTAVTVRGHLDTRTIASTLSRSPWSPSLGKCPGFLRYHVDPVDWGLGDLGAASMAPLSQAL